MLRTTEQYNLSGELKHAVRIFPTTIVVCAHCAGRYVVCANNKSISTPVIACDQPILPTLCQGIEYT